MFAKSDFKYLCNHVAKMKASERTASRKSIEDFYKLNKLKGKVYTFNHLKTADGQAQVYNICTAVEKRGTSARDLGSGRPLKVKPNQPKNQFCCRKWTPESCLMFKLVK